MAELAGQRILVTGGAGGIGEATARRFSGSGGRVAVADMAEAAGRSLVARLGPQAQYLLLDVTDPGAWAEATDILRQSWGGLDLAFLNAGVMSRPNGAPILDDVWSWLRPQDLEKNLAVNLRGVVHGTAALVPLMASGGTIIATASAAALDANPLDPFYSASKAAVIGYVRSMAPVLAPRGIRIAALCPVGVETAMTPSDIRGCAPRATPDDLAAAVEKLLDEAVSGEAWVAGVPGLAYRHDFPALRDFASLTQGRQI